MKTELHEWFLTHRPDEEYLASKAAESQILFVRDTLEQVVSIGLKYENRCKAYVIGTHRSKSVSLPVYEFHREDIGLRLTLRNNFHDWKMSVESTGELSIDVADLCDAHAEFSSLYCEGFPKDRCFTSYDKGKKHVDKSGREGGSKFTVELCGNYAAYTFLFLVVRSLYRR